MKILIADDHPIFRNGLKHILAEESGMIVEDEAENGRQVMSLLARKKYEDMEKQLRELCMYTVGAEFYQDMLRERSRIRQQRLTKAREQAERNRLVRDGIILMGLTGCIIGLIVWFVWIL